MGEEVRGLRHTNRQLQNSHGDVMYSIGDEAAKELIHMAYGHEQWWRNCLSVWGILGGGGQKGKNQDNCNSIINIIKLFIKMMHIIPVNGPFVSFPLLFLQEESE